MKQKRNLIQRRKQLIELNWRYELLLTEPAFGILAILNGQIGRGIRIIESAIATARSRWVARRRRLGKAFSLRGVSRGNVSQRKALLQVSY